MTTIIKINGLDVEMSDALPTKPGAYWWVPGPESSETVFQLAFNEGKPIAVRGEYFQPIVVAGLYSTSPLVPAVEVEKAYKEGYMDRVNDYQSEVEETFTKCRAKRVTEGGE